MKRLILTLAMAVAGVAMAELNSYWLAAYTEAYTGKAVSQAELGKYEAYYCTVDSVANLFDVEGTAESVAAYLAENYATGYAKIAAEASKSAGSAAVGSLSGAAALSKRNQFEFKSVYGDALVGSEYLALLFYDKDSTKGYRVMARDPETMAQGGALFSDNKLASSGAVTQWASVPEPTSGLLLLLGVAAFALKRKGAAV